jgi:hypothetical protein
MTSLRSPRRNRPRKGIHGMICLSDLSGRCLCTVGLLPASYSKKTKRPRKTPRGRLFLSYTGNCYDGKSSPKTRFISAEEAKMGEIVQSPRSLRSGMMNNSAKGMMGIKQITGTVAGRYFVCIYAPLSGVGFKAVRFLLSTGRTGRPFFLVLKKLSRFNRCFFATNNI